MGSNTSRALKSQRHQSLGHVLTELGHERALAIADAAALADPVERVHRQRISIRRLRSLIRLSAPVTSADEVDALDQDLAWIASKFGDQRDVDVLSHHLRADVQRFQADTVNRFLETVDVELERRRSLAESELRRSLNSIRYQELERSLQFLDLGAGCTIDESVQDSLAPLVHRQWKALNRARNRWRSADDYESWHRMRMRAKNLRYVLELFSPLYPNLNPCARELRDLTDLMGDVCDAHNEQEVLASVARCSDVAVAFDAGRLAAYSELAQTSVRGKLPTQWVRVHRSWKVVGW
jgi:CHAD domain-containing protein